MSEMTLNDAEIYTLRRMLGTLWIIPCDETHGLIRMCLDLEREGLCRVERRDRYEDGRISVDLTYAGCAALSPSSVSDEQGAHSE